jgi:apolipoprotein N-acyltransferase
MKWYLPYLSGLLVGAAFINHRLGFLVAIALLPMLVLISQKGRRRTKIIHIWLSGLLAYGFVMSWLLFTNPATWTAIKEPSATILVILSWLLTSLVFSLGWAFFGWVATLPSLKKISAWHLLLLPSAWVAGEYLRSWLFSVFWSSSQASLGAHWNFGNLGLGLVDTPLAALARLGGLFGLCFVAVVINLAIYQLFRKQYRAVFVSIGPIAFILVFSIVFYGPQESKDIRVGLAQLTNKASDIELLNQQLAQQPQSLDILLLPEYAASLENVNGSELLSSRVAKQAKVTIFSREEFSFNGVPKRQDLLVHADQNGQLQSVQDKSFLIPTGEYLPYVAKSLMKLSGQNLAIYQFQLERQLQKAESPEKVIEIANLRVGSIACSGVISPYLYRSLANQDSQILTNSASLNVFAKSPTYFEQARTMARFQAIANNQPFAQAARNGYSYLIDRNGKFVLESHNRGFQLLSGQVAIGNDKTLYTKLGEWVASTAIAMLLAVLLPWRSWLRRFQRSHRV